MSTCVKAVKESGGSNYILSLDMTTTDHSQCMYLVEDGTSNAWRELGNMSLENASQLGVAIGLVWAIAWGFRQVARTIRTTDTSAE